MLVMRAASPGTSIKPDDGIASAAAGILARNCSSCHGALKTSGLDLRTRASILKGGERGSALIPRDSSRSRLYHYVSGKDKEIHMPPAGPLSPGDIAILKRWIDAGAPMKAESRATDGRPWPFRSVTRPVVPKIQNPKSKIQNPIDSFIQAKLAEKGLRLSPPADRRTLIRRAFFDLIGLPPTPEEVEAFLSDRSDRSYENLVDRLLASPHYGERWARHWLDLARYAESEGFKADEMRSNAWRYRDYVIKSLNDDKPYDQFIREQIAGDELYPEDPDALVATGFLRHWADESNARNLLQRRQEILNDVTDTVGSTVLGLTFACARCHDHKYDPIPQKDYYRLQAFFAGIRPRDDIPLLIGDMRVQYDARLKEWEEKTAGIRAEISALEEPAYKKAYNEDFHKFPAEVQAAITMPAQKRSAMQWFMYHKAQPYFRPLKQDIENGLKGEQKARWQELQKKLDDFNSSYPGPLPTGLGVTDLGPDAPKTHVLSAGIYDKPLQEVQPGFPLIAGGVDSAFRIPRSGFTLASNSQHSTLNTQHSSGRRSALATWLTSPRNPMTARVLANRLWHYHFGQGLVPTPSDFGKQGEKPSHPELLDWLASELMNPTADDGRPATSSRNPLPWSLKHLHRLIVTSETYKQAGTFNAMAAKADPFNRLHWRFRRQRLNGETIRDSVLSLSGELNTKMGGPSVMPELPEGLTTRGYWKETGDPAERNRRSVYVFVKRNLRYPFFEAFDMPDTHEPCARRDSTTTATQSLMLLNNAVMLRASRAMAGRIFRETGADPAAQIDRAYRLAFARPPSAAESAAGLAFLRRQASILKQQAPDEEEDPLTLPIPAPSAVDQYSSAALVDLCHAILNSNEFLFVE